MGCRGLQAREIILAKVTEVRGKIAKVTEEKGSTAYWMMRCYIAEDSWKDTQGVMEI